MVPDAWCQEHLWWSMVVSDSVWCMSGVCLVVFDGVRSMSDGLWWCLMHVWWCLMVSGACLAMSGGVRSMSDGGA